MLKKKSVLEMNIKEELPDGSLLVELNFLDHKTLLDFAGIGFMKAITDAAEEAIAEQKKIDDLLAQKKLKKARKKLKSTIKANKSKRKRKNAST